MSTHRLPPRGRSSSTCERVGVRHRRRVLHRRDALPTRRFASFPMRIGHEWCGTVSAVGDGVDPAWVGRRTTGDTMLGCGRCRRCRAGLQHVCRDRYEIGIRGGFPGALAEQLALPVSALHPLPDSVDAVAGAMVEPGGNALRSVRAAQLDPAIGCWSSARAPSACSSPAGARGGCRGAPAGRDGAVAGLRPHPRLSRCVVRRRPAGAAVGRRHRRVDISRCARAGRRAGGTREADRLRRAVGHTQPDRHQDGGAEGRHGGGNPQRVNRSRPGRSSSTHPVRSIPGRWSPPPSACIRRARCSAGGARRAPVTDPKSISIRG